MDNLVAFAQATPSYPTYRNVISEKDDVWPIYLEAAINDKDVIREERENE
jgi:hypothetical protein